jgi:hypothetical protein
MIELSKLHAFVDGELSDSERREVESRLAGCSASRAEVNSIIGLKSTLKGSSEVDCSEVWATCKSRLDAIDRVAKSGNFITKYSWGFVTAVALIMVIGGGYARHAQASSVDSSSLAGVFAGSRSQSPEKVSRDAQLDKLLRYADRNLNAIKLVGVMNRSINGLPSRRYDLEDGKGRMSFLELPQITSFDGMAPNADGKYFYGQIEPGMKAVGWRVPGAALILVGPRDYPELEKIARSSFMLPE